MPIYRSLLLVFALIPTAHAQLAAATDPDYVPTLTFDIASIRQTAGITDHALRAGVKNPPHASTVDITNFPIKRLIQLAYGFDTPISGGPTWTTDLYFNIQAKSDPETDEKLAKLTDNQAKLEKQHMLRVLLADRMKLKTHLETKESSVYALVLAKGGSKLQELKADPDQPKTIPGADVKGAGGRQGLEFTVGNATSKSIAAILASQTETPVLDRTGLTGTYKFTLQIGTDWSTGAPDAWPDIFTAVQEQLGLKLDPIKASIPVLVIDHIEMPSEN
jgi:uncharacterized protein (TIGR03435 family)